MRRLPIYLPLLACLLSGCYAAAWNSEKLDYWSDQSLPEALMEKLPDLGQAEQVRMLVFGDSGVPEQFSTVAGWMAQACKADCDFALMLGDNFYLRGPSKNDADEFDRHFRQPLLRHPDVFGEMAIWVVLGNHGYVSLWARPPSEPSVQLQYTYSQSTDNGPYWLMPAHQYSIPGLPQWLTVVGFDSFFASDARSFHGDELEYGQARDEYVQAVYESVTAGQSDGWRVLFGHHPHVTMGAHYAGNRLKGVPDPFNRLLPLVYFSGHDHDQQLIDDGSLVQVIQGAASKTRASSWGAENAEKYFLDEVEPAYRAREESVTAAYCERLGFAIATFDRDSFHLVFYWGDEGARTPSGQRSWTWTRNAEGQLNRLQPALDDSFINLCP